MNFFQNMRGRYGRKADLTKQVEAYQIVFRSPHAMHFVLPDLAEFCGAVDPAPHGIEDQARAAGRRDVWLRIQRHLNLSDREVYALLKGDPLPRNTDGETIG